ncbi:RimK/LysX family protein [Candidatus Woesearchaeota archaeon]|nr:RimK/LysX family protein [Candidatus Woesearchaeota archaeon]
MKKKIVGLTENVTIYGSDKKGKKITARIDSGATKSSIDVRLAAELKLGPIIKCKLVKSTHGNTLRPVVKAKIKIADKKLTSELTIADRTYMKYRLLIGQNILKDANLIIDPHKGVKTKP